MAVYNVLSAVLPVSNLCSAISALSAQSYGAADIPRLKKIRKAGLLMTAVTAGLLTAFVLVFGKYLIAMFGAGPESMEIGRRFFLRLGSFYVIYGLNNALRGYLEGIGKVMYSSVVSMIMLGVRIILSYALVRFFGNMVIAWAEAFSWLFGLTVFGIKERTVRKELEQG